MSEEIKESPTGELAQGEFKMKKKRGRPKKLTAKDQPTKLDLSNKEETKTENNAVQEPRSDASNVPVEESRHSGDSKEVVSEVRESTATEDKKETVQESQINEKKKETPVIQEITEEVKSKEDVGEEIKEEIAANPNIELPENVEKLVDFMKDTGGNIEDYVRLNADYSNISESALLDEYYKKTRPHLEPDEVKFLMEDKFSYDDEMDEERDIRRKKLAYKEEIAKAKGFLEETKKKYYDEIKLRPGVTQEQQKAMDFFNRHNKEQGEIQKHHDQFKQNTKNYFNQDFKGFEFNLGEKRFRYNVNDINGVVENQSALSNFTKKFLNKDGSVSDLQGYHKALYAAQNADNIANHFYEQGRADAVKNITAKSKNISNESRKEPSGDIFINGLKVKAINGVDSSKLKIKKRKTI
tara:strand:+ start:252 stop:1484 length:1233 start_codon:yes stop_codon:yes gene_type:complete